MKTQIYDTHCVNEGLTFITGLGHIARVYDIGNLIWGQYKDYQ